MMHNKHVSAFLALPLPFQKQCKDVVYFDEKTEEVTEVHPINVTSVSSLSDISCTPLKPQVLDSSETQQLDLFWSCYESDNKTNRWL